MAEPIPLSGVARALGLMQRHARHHLAVVGGGGKTTLLHAIGQQLVGARVLTCTTKMGHDQHRGLPVLLAPTDDEVVRASSTGPVMVWKRVDGHKAVGVDPEACDRWFALVDHVVAEADGSRQRPFKAPAPYEPVVADTTTLMVSVIGADALGRVIADQCHRPLRVAALAGCRADERLRPSAAAAVLLHERGARKELPEGAGLAIVVTKVADTNREMVDQLVSELAAREPEVAVVAVAQETTSGFALTGRRPAVGGQGRARW